MSPGILEQLNASIQEELLNEFSQDFGGLQHLRPKGVVPIKNEDQMTAVLRSTRREKIPVAIRGGGLSCHGRTLTSGLVLHNQSSGCQLHQVTEDAVMVDARCSWGEFFIELRARRLAPKVLTYSLSPTVGGTLSAGGFGAASIQSGAQTDHVRRLRLLLPDGQATWCSPADNPLLFRSALGGFGRVGVIERVEMAVAPYRPLLLVSVEAFQTFSDAELALMRSQGDLFTADFTGNGLICRTGQWAGVQELFKASNAVSRDVFQSVLPAARAPGFWHVWCDYFVPPEALGRMLEFLDSELPRAGLDRIQILAIRTPPLPVHRTFLSLPRLAADRYFGIGVFYSVRADDLGTLRSARYAQRKLLDRCICSGGRPYLSGCHDLTETDLESIYGDEYRELQNLKRQLDPNSLFNSPCF
jgi:FAD/FMN-containing dehydrogenase